MADRRDEKILKLGGGGETIGGLRGGGGGGDGDGDGEDVVELDSSGGEVLIHRGEQRVGEVRVEKDLKLGDGGETIDAGEDVQKQDGNEHNDFSDNILDGNGMSLDGIAQSRYILQGDFGIGAGLDPNENDVANLEFGRNTNRLDYFRVTPFDVFEDDNRRRIADYGGGDGRPQIPVGVSSNNGHVAGDGGRENLGIVVSPTLYLPERANNTDARAGDIGPQLVAVGISSTTVSRGGGGGEVQKFEQESGGGGGSERWIGGGMVGVGWWEKLWLLFTLWKTV